MAIICEKRSTILPVFGSSGAVHPESQPRPPKLAVRVIEAVQKFIYSRSQDRRDYYWTVGTRPGRCRGRNYTDQT